MDILLEKQFQGSPDLDFDYMLSMKDMCNLLGVTPTALRYYDDHKAIETRRSKNGYRFFLYNDLLQCLKMKGYANLGFSTREAGDMTLKSSHDSVSESIDAALREKELEIRRLELHMEYLQATRDVLSKMEKLDGTFIPVMRPKMYWCPCQKNGKILRGRQEEERLRRWSGYAPFAEPCPILSAETLHKNSACDLGLCIQEKYVDIMSEEDRKAAICYEPEPCMLGLIYANAKIPDYYSVIEPSLRKLKASGFSVTGNILSTLVASDMRTPWRQEDYYDYYLCYFPVKDA